VNQNKDGRHRGDHKRDHPGVQKIGVAIHLFRIVFANHFPRPERRHKQRRRREEDQADECDDTRFHTAYSGRTTTSSGSNSTVTSDSGGTFSIGGALMILSVSGPTRTMCSLVSPRKLDSMARPVRRFLPLDAAAPLRTGCNCSGRMLIITRSLKPFDATASTFPAGVSTRTIDPSRPTTFPASRFVSPTNCATNDELGR